MCNKNKSNGFTLIELLVVIAIIALLSTLAMISLKDVRLKSRDSKRLSDLNSIATALHLFYSNHGEYPTPSHGYSFDSDSTLFISTYLDYSFNGDSFLPVLSDEGLMPNVPHDPIDAPLPGGGYYDYRYAIDEKGCLCGVCVWDGLAGEWIPDAEYAGRAYLFFGYSEADLPNRGPKPECPHHPTYWDSEWLNGYIVPFVP
ncbi:type II secretion system GspH family protein [Patescibacteria group bacterium]|nr:type II secretion system GspH family protein [Patescibacteria group bacterium]MBU1890812.1 type II secretion system GspH family protein [Patescibacteria group bacterium]